MYVGNSCGEWRVTHCVAGPGAAEQKRRVETDRAIQLLNKGGPLEIESADLDKQSREHAAAAE